MQWFLFLVAWTVFFLLVWNFWTIVRETVDTTQRLHQILCSNCQFFTKNYYLKCPVHPSEALTEDAIHCPDYFSIDRRV